MHTLTMQTAQQLAQVAVELARSMQLHPIAAATVDHNGHPLAILRDEHASYLRPKIALGKARGCIGMGFGGRELARRAQAAPQFFAAINTLDDVTVIPVAGGVLLRNLQGQLLGAIGISGDTSENDERCALAAIAQLPELQADAG